MRSTNHRGAQGFAPGIKVPLAHSHSYATNPPAFLIAATASRWIRARRTIQPNQIPITSTTTISPRTLKRRYLRQGCETGLGGSVISYPCRGARFPLRSLRIQKMVVNRLNVGFTAFRLSERIDRLVVPTLLAQNLA